jgi:hypothetical protein
MTDPTKAPAAGVDGLRLLAAEYLGSIDDPIRSTNEQGVPFLSYTAMHVLKAFQAGAAITAAEALPRQDDAAIERSAEALMQHGSKDPQPWETTFEAAREYYRAAARRRAALSASEGEK